MVKFTMLRCYC